MRRFIILVTAGVAAAAVTTGLLLSPAASQQELQRTTITLFDPNKGGFEKGIDERPLNKFGAGDWAVFRDPFFDPETCERAGWNHGRSVVIKPLDQGDAVAMFDGGIVLPDGKLAFQFMGTFGEGDSPEGAKIAVTGGTGAYKDARGEVTFTSGVELCDRRGSLAVVDLLLQ
jgi:hypothetical protein